MGPEPQLVRPPEGSGEGWQPRIESVELAEHARRIAVVAPCPFPVNHGTPGSIREIVQKQAERGHEVHVVTYPLQDDVPLDPRVRVHRVPMLGRCRRIQVGPTWRRPFWDALAVLKLAQVIDQYNIELIHAYNYEGALIGWVARGLMQTPLVFTTFNTMQDELPSYEFLPYAVSVPLSQFLDTFVPHTADRVIAISPELVELLDGIGVGKNRVSEIPMGIDPREIEGGDGNRIRQEYGLGSRPLVVYTGLLNAFQRIDILIDAWADVLAESPEARLLLVANYLEPDDPGRILDHCRRLELEDSVILTDERPFSEVRHYLAAADVTIVPRPNCPGVPIKMLNYLAAGKAVVTPEGSAKGLVDEQEALLAKDGDPKDLARQVLRLLRNEHLRARVADAGRRALLDRFSLDAICRGIESVYDRL